MTDCRILLADDHALVRAGIRAILRDIPNLQVIGEAGDGHDALKKIESFKPDIALVDVAMPGLNGLDIAARVAKEFPATRVIILSMHKTEEYVLQALRVGASGYVLKDANADELEFAIRAVWRGESYLSPAVSKSVIDDYMRRLTGGPFKTDPSPGPFETLTPRQREILQLIAEGHTTQEIANKLTISVKTVETHRAQLMDRLGIHEIAGLVRYAIRTGIITEP
jgi:DNA-binding NarL/FixJ family response regulator